MQLEINDKRFKLVDVSRKHEIVTTYRVLLSGTQIGFIRRYHNTACNRPDYGYQFNVLNDMPSSEFVGAKRYVNECLVLLEGLARATYDKLGLVEFKR